MSIEPPQQRAASERSICLVGNPNTGKSVLFGILTGRYVTVSNYPGTTVEISAGSANLHGHKCRIIDTPGTNSLIPMSEDEQVTRDILIEQPPDVVVQVGDSKNLKRVLAISVQLVEMGLPMTVALNMADEAAVRGIQIDYRALSEALGVDVIGTVAVEKKNVSALIESALNPRSPRPLVSYPAPIEDAADRIAALLPEGTVSGRAIALMLLSADDSLTEWTTEALSSEKMAQIDEIRAIAERSFREPLSQIINRQRMQEVDAIFANVTSRTEGAEGSVSRFISRMAMHPIWGLPFLALVLWMVWKFVGIFGAGTLVGLIEETLFGKYINPFFVSVFNYIPVPFIRDLFVGEYGIITMALTYGIAIVLPVVFTFFICFGALEDSGYLPRLAVMVNSIFRAMGLNGKAVLPMVLGLGCDTMATLTTRVLESKRERVIVTLLLALGVPCSAQLGVIMALLRDTRSLFIWAGVVGLVILLVGFLAGKLMPGKSSDFILEVPPIRLPRLGNILVKTLARTEWYLKEALPLFVIGTLILFLLDKLTLLGLIETATKPIVTGVLGLPSETASAFIMGFLRRDYGGAGLLMLYDKGRLEADDVLVALITITLFIPCVANFIVMIKERGWQTATLMALFIVPFSILVGGMVRLLLNWGIF